MYMLGSKFAQFKTAMSQKCDEMMQELKNKCFENTSFKEDLL